MARRSISEGLKRAQSRLLNMNSRKVLNNVFLLYVVLFVAITDILYMVGSGSYINVGIFILAGYVTSMFSKNMMIIMLIALAVTNIYELGRKIVLKEGFNEKSEDDEDGEDGENDEDDEDGDNEENDEDENNEEKKKGEKKKSSSKAKEQVPVDLDKVMAKLNNPETMRTIEGLKSLDPLLRDIKELVNIFD